MVYLDEALRLLSCVWVGVSHQADNLVRRPERLHNAQLYQSLGTLYRVYDHERVYQRPSDQFLRRPQDRGCVRVCVTVGNQLCVYTVDEVESQGRGRPGMLEDRVPPT